MNQTALRIPLCWPPGPGISQGKITASGDSLVRDITCLVLVMNKNPHNVAVVFSIQVEVYTNAQI